MVLAAVWLAPRVHVRRALPAWHGAPIVVQVSGEVVRPGLLELPFGARVVDAVEAAGGVTSAGDVRLLALASPLHDGQTVVVPGRRTAEGNDRLSLNEASERDLDDLPGIGPSLARRIVDARPFTAVDDLLGVSGIGPATLERLRPWVRP